MNGQKEIWAVIPAAGAGTRMGSKIHKQFICLEGREILAWTLDVFVHMEEISGIVLVCSEEDQTAMRELAGKYGGGKTVRIVRGGETRQESVCNGLQALPADCGTVLIHDGARPFVLPEQIRETIRQAEENGGALLAVPVKDTIKVTDGEGYVKETPVRAQLFSAQTPQTFRMPEILQAHLKARNAGDNSCTDDSQIMEKYGSGRVRIVSGSYENLKITTPEDLKIAEEILHERKTV